jgi:hypothetical protein
MVRSCLEVVAKPPLRPNSCVGLRDSILETDMILCLNPLTRLFIPLGFSGAYESD